MTAYSWAAVCALLAGFYFVLYCAVMTLARYDR